MPWEGCGKDSLCNPPRSRNGAHSNHGGRWRGGQRARQRARLRACEQPPCLRGHMAGAALGGQRTSLKGLQLKTLKPVVVPTAKQLWSWLNPM
jgi:hypothetical protein